MPPRYTKSALIAFSLFLAGLVVLADSGHGGWLFALAGRIPAGDKLGHFLLFGTLSCLLNGHWRGKTLRLFGRTALWGSTLIMAVVTLEECSQVFFRSRTFDLLDLTADAVGIWFGGRLVRACLRRPPARPPATV